MKKRKGFKSIPYEKKKSLAGLLFISPWLIGFLFLFLRPLFKSFLFSINSLSFEKTGIIYEFVGVANYIKAFTIDADFIVQLTASMRSMIMQVPLIIMFSLFVAMILNQEFKGRTLARVVFFLPVIIASGVVMNIIMNLDVNSMSMMSGSKSSVMNVQALGPVLVNVGIPLQVITFIIEIANNIFQLFWKSGIQILIFLAGLQTIPSSVYEASSIEGATAWESFWKITFPMISPMIMVNIVYSIIDNFTDVSNPLIERIRTTASGMDLSYSATMSWIYFAFIVVVLAVVYFLVNRHVFYLNDD